MLTRTMEGGVKKCAKYLPKSVGVAEQRGLFKITLDSFGAFPEDQVGTSPHLLSRPFIASLPKSLF